MLIYLSKIILSRSKTRMKKFVEYVCLRKSLEIQSSALACALALSSIYTWDVSKNGCTVKCTKKRLHSSTLISGEVWNAKFANNSTKMSL